MEVFNFLSQFIFFIVPGIIFTYISGYLLNEHERDQIKFSLNIFVVSTLSFVIGNFILSLLNQWLPINFVVTEVTLILNDGQISQASLVSAIFISVLTSLLFVFMLNNNLIFKIANKCKITNRSNNYDIWDELFIGNPWIIFRDYITNYSYFGRVEEASDRKEDRELLLCEVSVFDESGNELYEMEKIYLLRKPSEFSIEIDNYTEVTEK